MRVDVMEKIEIGDKVKMSNKALQQISEKLRPFVSRMVYLVIDKEVSMWQGVRLKLHCGTTLMYDEAEKVDSNTELFT